MGSARRRVTTTPLSPSSDVIFQDEWDMATVNDSLIQCDTPKPCTISLKQTVPSDKVGSFREWQTGILAANKQSPGFQGATVIEETQESTFTVIVILRYDSPKNARIWNESSTRKHHLSALEAIIGTDKASSAQISFEPDVPRFVNVLSKGRKQTFWNNRRMWFCIWAQVFSLVELYEWLLPYALGEAWEGVGLHLKLALSTALTTLTIDLVTMRFVVRIAKYVGFLY
mmetsp:Transcript_19285/g.38521  ORF Transcript_19285/g.38521 Transcript_19285/m.38521 type:complete len:228 (+) Transcript_19285:39-722(+)